MTIEVERLSETFFARVQGVDLTAPLVDETCKAINQALLDHGVLWFPDQPVSDVQQVVFSKWFGPLEETFEDPELFTAYLGNVDYDGSRRSPDSRMSSFLRANQLWHSDSTIFQAPARISFLTAHAVPAAGGETEWADMQAAWEALPEERQRELDGLVIEHDFQNSRIQAGHEFDEEQRRRWPPIRHPLVRVHEETGRKSLYVGSQATHVVGRPVDEGRVLIRELIGFATQDRFIHTHHWSLHDLVMWDNRRVNHRGRPWDEQRFPRDLRRTTVKGRIPTMDGDHPVNEHQAYRRLLAEAS